MSVPVAPLMLQECIGLLFRIIHVDNMALFIEYVCRLLSAVCELWCNAGLVVDVEEQIVAVYIA